ncbi:MAG: cyanophycinase, partial [Bacteroidia bacterium]|nr:cyanophycinase [Bacteroidia bacterium]
VRSFNQLGCNNIGLIHIKKREDAHIAEYSERISKADAVLFSGGNQLRLGTILGGTGFLNIIHERYWNEEGFIVAGTSAGAMAMSNTMIYQGNSATAHLKGEVKITTGLAFINNVIIDSHFDKRGRFSRLAQAVASNPSCTGIGLGEDTGVVISGNNHMEVIGSGAVIIVDGRDINYSNIADIPEGNPISIENMRVSVLVSGNSYNLKEREFISASDPQPTL